MCTLGYLYGDHKYIMSLIIATYFRIDILFRRKRIASATDDYTDDGQETEGSRGVMFSVGKGGTVKINIYIPNIFGLIDDVIYFTCFYFLKLTQFLVNLHYFESIVIIILV